MMRRSECITAVMVLPAAKAGAVQVVEAASADSVRPSAMPSLRRERWDIRSSPDVKLVKARSLDGHEVRYLGGLTRCKSLSIETCTKPLARQSRFGGCVASARGCSLQMRRGKVSYAQATHDPEKRAAVFRKDHAQTRKYEREIKNEPRQPSLRFRGH